MKFIISENRLISMVFKYLDNQDFILSKKSNDIISFIKSDKDLKVSIIYNKKYEKIGISESFLFEIKNFFSMKSKEAEKLIGQWVCNKLNLEQKSTIVLPVIIDMSSTDEQ